MVAKMAVKKQEKIVSEDEESWASGAEDDFESDGAEQDQMDDAEGDDWEEGDLEDPESVKEDGEPAIKRAKTDTELAEARKSRDDQKALLVERKLAKPNAPLIQEAKKLWEKLRQKSLKTEERTVVMGKMMELITGKCQEVIFKHDASRIIQCCLKYGNTKQRDLIAAELKGHYAELSKSQYGRFIVSKILNYCSPSYRTNVIKEFYGKVRKLIRHKEASAVLEEAYSQFANATQRSALMEEFYGPEYALFKSNEAITVHDMIKKNPLKKDSITRHLGEVVNSILEKGTCNIATVSIVHRAVLEYLLLAEDKAIQDMIDLLKDHLVHILHTREGARVAQLCILHSTSKNRKHIIKSFKGFVGKIAREQYGHAALITCFECVDDTVLLQKAIMAELLKDGTEGPNDTFVNLLRSKFGSRLVLYILMGRNRKYQPAYLVNELDEMDVVRAKTSKKDDALRKKELLDAISAPLLTAIENHANELLRDRQGGQVVSETLRLAVGDKSKAIHAVASLTAETPDAMEKEDEDFKKKEAFHAVKALKAQADKARLEETIIMDDHILVNRNATFALKDILSGGNRGKDASTTSQGNAAFAQALFDQIQSRLSYWINYCIQDPLRSSGTAFVLFNMMENAESNLRKTLKTEVKTILSKMKNVDAQISSKKAQGQSEKIQVTKNTNNKKRKKGQDASPNDTPVRKTAVEMLLDASRA